MVRAEEKKRRRLAGRLARLGLWLAAGLAGLLLLAWLALLLFLPDEKIRRLALDEVSRLLGAPVHSGPLQVGLLSGFSLEGLRLGAPPGFAEPVLTVERIGFSYAPLQLLRGRLLVREVVLEGPALRVEQQAGVLNVGALLAGSGGAADSSGGPADAGELNFDLDVRRLRLVAGSVRLLFPGVRLALAGVRLDARLLLDRKRGRRVELELDWPPPEESNLQLGGGGMAGFTCRLGGRLRALLDDDRWQADIELRLADSRWDDGQAHPLVLLAELEGAWPPPAGPLVVKRLRLRQEQDVLLRASGRLGRGWNWRAEYSLHPPRWLLDLLARRLGMRISGRLAVEEGRARGDLSGRLESAARLVLEGVQLAGGGLVAGGLKGSSRLTAERQGGGFSGRLSATRLQLDSLAGPGWRAKSAWLTAGGRVAMSDGPGGAGIELEHAVVDLHCHRLKLGTVTAGNLVARLTWPEAEAPERRRLNLEGRAARVRLAGTRVIAPRLEADLAIGAVAPGGLLPEGAGIEARLAAARLESGPVRAEGITATVSGRMGAGGNFRGSLRAGVRRLAAFRQRPLRLPGPLRLQMRLAAGRQRLVLERSRWEFQQLGTLQVSGSWRRPSGEFDADWQGQLAVPAAVAGLRPLWRLPGRLSGRLRLAGRLHGSLPPAAGAQARAGAEATVRFEELAFEDEGIAVAGVSGRLQLSWPQLEGKKLAVSGKLVARRLRAGPLGARQVDVDLHLERGNSQVGLRLSSRAGRLRFDRLAGQPWKRVGLEIEGSLLAGKEGRLRRLFLRLPSAGLEIEGEGQALVSDTAAWPPRFSFSGSLGVRLDAGRPVRWGGGLVLGGRAAAELGVRSAGQGKVSLSGDFEFAGLDVGAPGFSARRLAGHVQVRQDVQLHGGGVTLLGKKQRRLAAVRPRSAYEQALGPLRAPASGVRAQEVRLGGLRLERPRADIELDHGLLRVGGLRLGLLGGDVTAELGLVLAPSDRRALGMWLEASDVDLGRLTAIAGTESRVGGNMRLAARADRHELDASVHLTSIGRGALQALLRGLDPGGGNPSLARLHEMIERYQVAPRSVSLQLRRGLLDLAIDLDMGPAARTVARLIRGFEGQTFRLSALPVGPWLNSVLARLRRTEMPAPGR
ncbi:MAG: hypothetical protein DRI34_08460 [Deltaproteobacteria bacterium]|nr:MAG: hypothetical protein DRI34_08460 [Deltaproteobacteria bacterium]